MFPFFDHGGCGVLAPWPGIEPTPSALEGEVLTTEQPGRSQIFTFIITLKYLRKESFLKGFFFFSVFFKLLIREGNDIAMSELCFL